MVVHLREGSVPHVKDMKCDQDAWAWIVSSSEVVLFFTGMLNKEFRFVLTKFKTIIMERIIKPLHYILVVYTREYYIEAFGLMTGGPKMWLAHLSYSQKQME